MIRRSGRDLIKHLFQLSGTAAKLYNVVRDIGEAKGLAAAMPEKVKELQAKWDDWNTANIEPRWGSAHTDNDGAEPGRPTRKESQECKGRHWRQMTPSEKLKLSVPTITLALKRPAKLGITCETTRCNTTFMRLDGGACSPILIHTD